jgi:hypothetical protein
MAVKGSNIFVTLVYQRIELMNVPKLRQYIGFYVYIIMPKKKSMWSMSMHVSFIIFHLIKHKFIGGITVSQDIESQASCFGSAAFSILFHSN